MLWFPTKQHWHERSRMADIEGGLLAIEALWGEDLRSWAFPALGCGLGGLSWDQVRPLMEAHLAVVAGDVVVYEPPAPPQPRNRGQRR
ncbi:MAG: macro domain-containing protein [Thermomicrobiales bacterium]